MAYVVLVIIAIALILMFLEIVFSLLKVAFPVLVGAAIIFFIIYFVARQYWLKSMDLRNNLKKYINMHFDGTVLKSSIKKVVVEETNYVGPAFFSVFLGIIGFVAVFVFIEQYSNLHTTIDLIGSLKINRQTYSILSFILGAWLFAILIAVFAPIKSTKKMFQKKLEYYVEDANISLANLDTLRDILEEMQEYASEIGIQFEDIYSSAIQDYIEGNKYQILTDPSGLEECVNAQVKLAHEDCKWLRKARDLYNELMEQYSRASDAVNQVGSNSLVFALDKILQAIDKFKDFLSSRKWGRFFAEVDRAILKLGDIKKCVENNEYYDEKDPYKILRVSRDTPFENIKAIYYKLISAYHSDHNLVQDDKAAKEINAAFDQIKRELGIR